MKKLLVIPIIMANIVFFSCKKTDKNPVTSKDDLLCSTNCWKPISKIIDSSNDNVANGVESIMPCEIDNCEVFYSNGTGYIDYGSSICENEVSVATTWYWLNEEKTKLRYKQNNNIFWDYTIIELTENKIIYEVTFDFTANNGDYKKITTTAIR